MGIRHTQSVKGLSILEVTGNLSAQWLRTMIDGPIVLSGSHQIIVDCTRMDSISPQAVKVLVDFKQMVSPWGDVKLVGLNPTCRRVFGDQGLIGTFEEYDDVGLALVSFGTLSDRK